jgi:hypothetical protein
MKGEELHRRQGESAAQWLERLRGLDLGESASLRGERALLLDWARKAAWREAAKDVVRALSSRSRQGRPVRSAGGRSALDRAKDAIRPVSAEDLSQLRQWLAVL